jgi:hypothetical protein
MIYALALFTIALLSALVWLGYNAIVNHREVQRLKRNGYRKLAARRYRRGFIESEIVQALAELTLLILLLIAVFGWMGFR